MSRRRSATSEPEKATFMFRADNIEYPDSSDDEKKATNDHKNKPSNWKELKRNRNYNPRNKHVAISAWRSYYFNEAFLKRLSKISAVPRMQTGVIVPLKYWATETLAKILWVAMMIAKTKNIIVNRKSDKEKRKKKKSLSHLKETHDNRKSQKEKRKKRRITITPEMIAKSITLVVGKAPGSCYQAQFATTFA